LVEIRDQEATGIYLFNDKIFDVLTEYSSFNKTRVFDIASHILTYLNNIDHAAFYSYNLTEIGIQWADIESPNYVERKDPYIMSIIKQMNTLAEK